MWLVWIVRLPHFIIIILHICYLLFAFHIPKYLQVRHVIKRWIAPMMSYWGLLYVHKWWITIKLELVVLFALYETVLWAFVDFIWLSFEPARHKHGLFSRVWEFFMFLLIMMVGHHFECWRQFFGAGRAIKLIIDDVSCHFLEHSLNVLIFHRLFMDKLVLQFWVLVYDLDLKKVALILVVDQIVLHWDRKLFFRFR